MPGIRHKSKPVSSLAILVGYRCNFSCAHCITAGKTGSLSPADDRRILSAIKKYNIRDIHFVGGETSLFIKEINRLLAKVPDLDKIRVRMTTNGSFARTVPEAERVLSMLLKIDNVEFSYDKFHKKFLPPKNVRNLYQACENCKIGFGVLFAAESPMDLVLLEDLSPVGEFPVSVQYVAPFGAAAKNSVAWRHRSSEGALLKRNCPTKGKLIYICHQGFTICCSALTLCLKSDMFVHPTPGRHFLSAFYKLISSCSMGEIKSRLSVKGPLPGRTLISVCAVCEYLFSSKFPGLVPGCKATAC